MNCFNIIKSSYLAIPSIIRETFFAYGLCISIYSRFNQTYRLKADNDILSYLHKDPTAYCEVLRAIEMHKKSKEDPFTKKKTGIIPSADKTDI